MHIAGTAKRTVVPVAVIVASAASGSNRCMIDTAAPTRKLETSTCWPSTCGNGATAKTTSSANQSQCLRAELARRADPAVREDGALRSARRPGREEERRRLAIVSLDRLRRGLALDRQRAVDDRHRARRRDARLDLGRSQKNVQRHRDRAGPKCAEVGGDVGRRVREPDRHAVAHADARGAQGGGRDGGPPVELAVRDDVALEQQGGPAGVLGCSVGEDACEVHRVGASGSAVDDETAGAADALGRRLRAPAQATCFSRTPFRRAAWPCSSGSSRPTSTASWTPW